MTMEKLKILLNNIIDKVTATYNNTISDKKQIETSKGLTSIDEAMLTTILLKQKIHILVESLKMDKELSEKVSNELTSLLIMLFIITYYIEYNILIKESMFIFYTNRLKTLIVKTIKVNIFRHHNSTVIKKKLNVFKDNKVITMKDHLYFFMLRRLNLLQITILFFWYVISFKLFGTTSVSSCEGSWLANLIIINEKNNTVEIWGKFDIPKAPIEESSSNTATDSGSEYASDNSSESTTETFSARQVVANMLEVLTADASSKTPYIDLLNEILPSKDHPMFTPNSKEAEAMREQMVQALYESYYIKCHSDLDPKVTENMMVNLITSFKFYAYSVNDESTINLDVKSYFESIPNDIYNELVVLTKDELNDYVEQINNDYKEMEEHSNE